MTPEEIKRYNDADKHDFVDIGGNVDGTFWWCRRCGTVEHNDNEFGPHYVPTKGGCHE